MNKQRLTRGVVALGATVSGIYLLFLHPWIKRWKATGAERQQFFPGDDAIAEPNYESNRAITIRARAADIWPWLVQMGNDRAGWYSYDWFDNAGLPSADHIVPGRLLQYIAYRPPQPLLTWAFVLTELDREHTRLLIRYRARTRRSPLALLFRLVGIGEFILTRKTLLGIRQRAECVSGPRKVSYDLTEA